jgi:outer membrane protein TolC
MGEPLGVQFQFVSRPRGPAAINLDDVRARAAENRPEIRAAHLRLEQAQLAIRSKKLEWIPDLNLTLTHFAFLNAGNLAPRSARRAFEEES